MKNSPIAIVPNKPLAVERALPAHKQIRELAERLDPFERYLKELHAANSELKSPTWMSEQSFENAKNIIERFSKCGFDQQLKTLEDEWYKLNPERWWDEDDDDKLNLKLVSVVLSKLIGSFPSSNIPNVQVYTRQLLEDVAELEPSYPVLESACQKLRTTMKFTPAICEVVEAIEAEEEAWGNRTGSLWVLANVHKEATGLLAAGLEKREIERQERETEKQKRDAEIAAAKQRIDEINAARGLPIIAGDRVKHGTFGHGTVKEVLGVNMFRVAFDAFGERRVVGEGFLERLAKCEGETGEDTSGGAAQ